MANGVRWLPLTARRQPGETQHRQSADAGGRVSNLRPVGRPRGVRGFEAVGQPCRPPSRLPVRLPSPRLVGETLSRPTAHGGQDCCCTQASEGTTTPDLLAPGGFWDLSANAAQLSSTPSPICTGASSPPPNLFLPNGTSGWKRSGGCFSSSCPQALLHTANARKSIPSETSPQTMGRGPLTAPHDCLVSCALPLPSSASRGPSAPFDRHGARRLS